MNASPRLQRAASDFQTEGVSLSSARLPRWIFFERDHSDVPSTESGKISPLATPPTRDLTLCGYASEEGPASRNTALATARARSVATLLGAAGHDPTHVTETPTSAAGVGQVDYRQYRAVEVKEGAAVECRPDCSTATTFTAPCPTGPTSPVDTAFQRAAGLVLSAAISLSLPEWLAPASHALARRLFRGADLDDVRDNLLRIFHHLAFEVPGHLTCLTPCSPECAGGYYGWNLGTGPTAEMRLCPGFLDDPDVDSRARKAVHEGSHGTDGLTAVGGGTTSGTDDLAYYFMRLFPRLSGGTPLGNADHYSVFVLARVDPSRLPADPEAGDTSPTLTSDERDRTQAAVAHLQLWLVRARGEVVQIYRDAHESFATAPSPAPSTWSPSGYTDTWDDIRRLYGVSSAWPNETTKRQLAAIYDRMNQGNFATQRALTFEKVSGAVTWEATALGPGTRVEVNDPFLAPALADEDRVQRLLVAMSHALAGVSSSFEPKWVELIRNIRDRLGLAP